MVELAWALAVLCLGGWCIEYFRRKYTEMERDYARERWAYWASECSKPYEPPPRRIKYEYD